MVKPLTEFGKSKTQAPDGYTYRCKLCINAYRRQQYKDKPEVREKDSRKHKLYNRMNPHFRPREVISIAKSIVSGLKLCGGCKQEKSISEFRLNRSSQDGFQDRCKKCQNKHHRELYAVSDKFRQYVGRKRVRAADRRYKSPNSGANKSRWAKKHPNQIRRYAANRRARVIGNGGYHTVEEWLALCEKYGNRCLACGQVVELTEDHIMPLVRGGTDSIDNIQPLCRVCNSRKKTQFIDYRQPFVAMAT